MKIFLSTIAVGFCIMQANVYAKLLVTPTRVELNNSNKVQSLKLINESSDADEEITYNIGYMYQKMNKDGSYTKLTPEEEKERSAIQSMIIYSPRQVTLKPGETQTVRFALRRKDDMKDEINAHILFQEVQKTSAVPQLAKKTDDGNFSIEIKPMFNIAVPVFVSNATDNDKIQAEISNAVLDREANKVLVTLTSTGKYSPYGRIMVKFYKGRKILDEKEVNGVGISMPLNERIVEVSYDDTKLNEEDIDSIHVVYQTAPDAKRSYTISEKTVSIDKVII